MLALYISWLMIYSFVCVVFFQAEDGIRDLVRSRGLGDVYKRQISYYRLKQVDYDGQFSYSEIVSVEIHNLNEDFKLSLIHI